MSYQKISGVMVNAMLTDHSTKLSHSSNTIVVRVFAVLIGIHSTDELIKINLAVTIDC